MRRLALCGAVVAVFLSLPLRADADVTGDCVNASEKAQQLRDEHKLIKAREQFLACAQDACPGAVKKDCADQVAELDKRTPSVVVHAKDKNGQDLVTVKVTSDGEVLTEQLDGRAVRLDPGVHTVRFEAPGNEPVEQKVVLGEGEHDRPITASFGSGGAVGGAPGKKGAPIGAIVLASVGVVAMGVGGVFYALGFSQLGTDQSATGCKNMGGCSSGEINSIQTKLAVGDIAFYSGIAMAAVGIVWAIVHYTSSNKEASAPPAARFDFAPTTLGRGGVASTTIRW
jgi:hypothetical protein